MGDTFFLIIEKERDCAWPAGQQGMLRCDMTLHDKGWRSITIMRSLRSFNQWAIKGYTVCWVDMAEDVEKFVC